MRLARHIAELIDAVCPLDERRRTRFVRPEATLDELEAWASVFQPRGEMRGERLLATKKASKLSPTERRRRRTEATA